MHARRTAAPIGLLMLWACCGAVGAEPASPEELLQSKGLSKRMNYFCLAGEPDLNKVLGGPQAEAVKRKKAVDAAQEAAAAAKAKVDEIQKSFLQWREEYDKLRIQLQRATTGTQRSRLIERMNSVTVAIDALPVQMQKADKSLQEARAAAAQKREEFIQYLMKLRKQYDELADRYRQLADDAQVYKAVEEYSRAARRSFTLGPMKATTDALKRLEADVISEEIPIHQGQGRLWYVFVTFNDQPPQELAIDTGASLISLPWKTAETVGLAPSSQSPKFKVQLADGRTVEARLVVADVVRVGKFTVEKVRCAVMPEDLTEAMPLLGLSFLGQFNFKVDQEKARLVMAAGGQGAKDAKAGASRTGRPSSPADSAAGSKPADGEAGKPAAKTAAEQIADLLKVEGQEGPSRGAITLQGRSGQRLVFNPSKRGPAKTLQERFGEPDEIHKWPAPQPPGEQPPAEPVFWKLWIWGPLKVLVDETGTTRYFSVPED